jgi:hypothetical protein
MARLGVRLTLDIGTSKIGDSHPCESSPNSVEKESSVALAQKEHARQVWLLYDSTARSILRGEMRFLLTCRIVHQPTRFIGERGVPEARRHGIHADGRRERQSGSRVMWLGAVPLAS